MEIRYFREDDLLQIASIEKLSINPPWSYNALCDFARYDTNNILVCEENSEIWGYITYSIIIDEVQIANVAVHPSHRRKGIGKCLLDTLHNKARQDNMSTITLEVRQSNTPAIALYEKCGYYVVGTRKGYYKNPTEDAKLMNLTL